MAEGREPKKSAKERTASSEIRKSKDDIIRDWELLARQEIPSTRTESHYTVIDSLPQFLEELIDSLESQYPKLVVSEDIATNHAAHRLSLPCFDLSQVFSEYNLLRKIVFSTLDRAQITLTPKDRDIITEFIQQGKQAAAVRFTQLVQERQDKISLALRQSEELHRQTFEQAAVGMAHLALDGKWLRVNSKLCEIVGYTREELSQLTFQDITHPKDLNKDLGFVERLLNHELPYYQIEKRYFRKDESIVWVELTVSLVENIDGKPDYFIAVVVDISERKQVEVALQESENRYRTLIDSMTEEVHYWELIRDQNGKIMDWRLISANSPALKSWNKSLADIRYKTSDEIFGPGTKDHFYPIVERVFRSGKPYSYENYFPKLDRYYRFTTVPVGDRFFTTGADITDFKKAGLAIEESEKRFREIANALPQIIWTATADFYVDWYNDWWYQYLGLPRGTRWDDPDTLPMHPEDVERTRPLLMEAVETGHDFMMEQRFKRGSDGQYRWHKVHGVPIRDTHGRVTKWIGANTDIHEQKLLVQKLEEERELREKFVSTLSHDLRTPLASIKLSTQVLRRTHPGDEKLIRTSERILTSVNRSDQMIQDLLDTNRISAGETLPIKCETCNLSSIVHSAMDDMRHIHNREFNIVESAHDIQGYWDCSGIQRIIENLCNNAVKYGAPDQPITVSTELATDARVRIHVHNEGNPIPQDEQTTLFVPFKRSKDAQESGKIGWGIGLTLVRGVVEAHGGEVSVNSSAAEGTTFSVILPLNTSETRDASADSTPKD
ncbi:MAG: PAS domain S-box protein [Bdellovibrionia bacterium]